MLRVFLSLLLVLFVLAGQKTALAADLLSGVALPQELFDEMVEAGIGEWQTLKPVAGTKLTIGRPVMCEACGTPFFSQPNAANNTCPTCPHPVTANSRRFITPKQVLPDGSLKIFTPLAAKSSRALSPQAKAAYAAIAELIPELQPCGCGRLNNPLLPNNSCWGCGAPIDKTNIRPAQKATTTIVADEQMPSKDTVQDSIQKTRQRTMRGSVAAAPDVVAPRTTRRISPRFVRTAVIGGVSSVAMAGIALGIGYVMTGDDVHVSRGRVEVVSAEEVRIHVPGFAQPLVLKYDSDTQYDNELYTKTTLEMYQNVDMVDVWWTREDGVIQVLPIDLFSISGGVNE